MKVRILLFLFFIWGVGTCSLAQQVTKIVGGGHTDDAVVTTSDAQVNQPGLNTIGHSSNLPNLNAASRFLSQCTFGADYELIEHVAQIGYSNWLDDQFALSNDFSLNDHLDTLRDIAESTSSMELHPNHYPQYWMFAWWENTLESPSLLKARIAFALSQIFVVSQNSDLGSWGLANYYDMLLDNAFGNFRTILEDVTYHPAMGYYLSHVNNQKANGDIHPDENFAREILQLFSIGLYELNQDGSLVLDDQGFPIETYTHSDVAEYAKVFTGFRYFDDPIGGLSEGNLTHPMAMDNTRHDESAKHLLNNVIIPENYPVDGVLDVTIALDSLFYHSNVGPFIGKQLIQRLVKSNPSPSYVERVSLAFNNNGSGVRGDMKAVIKAILLDPEARECVMDEDYYEGKLKEPVLRLANLLRVFNATGDSARVTTQIASRSLGISVEQAPLRAPSVFNFYLNSYRPPGRIGEANKVAPEFQINNDYSLMSYFAHLDRWLLATYGSQHSFRDELDATWYSLYVGQTPVAIRLDLTDEITLLEDGKVGDVLDRLNILLCQGNMTAITRAHIFDIIDQIPEYQNEIKVRMAILLVMASPDYLVLK